MITLDKVKVAKEKKQYLKGDKLNIDDLTVVAVYTDGSEVVITNYITNADEIDMDTIGKKELVIAYEENFIVRTVVLEIVVGDKQDNPTPNPDPESKPTPEPAPCVHSWKAATCTKAKTCVLFGVAEGVAKGHKAGTARIAKKATTTKSGTKVQKCTRCNTTVKTIKIKPAKLSLSKSSFTYTGKYISSKKLPKIIVKDGNGKTISSKYYTVKKPTNVKKMKKIGRYAYKITFKKSCKDYTGSKTVYLQITPKKTSVSSVRGTKKAVTVKWKKGKKAQVTGYQVMLATNSKFTKNKKTTTVKGYSKTSAKVTKLKAKTKYFVKVRTYKTVKGVKIYSDWSKVKTVRTK